MAKFSGEPATRRATRSTRSQSREVSEAPSSTIASPAKQRKGRKPNRRDLAIVNEDEDENDEEQADAQAFAYENNPPLTTSAEDEDVISIGAARRVSQHSGYSGTTAKTSFSQEEIGDMDADIMIANLPNTASAAEDLARCFLPSNRTALRVIWKDIRTPSSKQNKLYTTRVQTFDIYSRSFGSQDYIQPTFVLRALLGVISKDAIPAGPWRPDSVIYKINLIRMMRNMLIMPPDSADFSDHDLDDLVILDDLFLTAVAGSKLDREALKMCLAVQTQVALGRLKIYHAAAPNFSANETISNVFLSVNEDDELIYKHVDAFHDVANNDHERRVYDQLIDARINEMRSAFNRPYAHAIATLRARFSWDTFVDELITYYEVRKTQLDNDIAKKGGAHEIVSSLEQEVQKRSDARAAAAKRESLLNIRSTPGKSAGKGAMARLKAREQEQRRSAQEAPQPDPTPINVEEPDIADHAPVEMPDDGFPNVDDYVEQPQRSSDKIGKPRFTVSRPELAGFQAFQRNNSRKNGERARFTDEQPNAERLEWGDESQPTQRRFNTRDESPIPAASSASQRPRASASKRTITEVEEENDFDPTQDEGFQEDDRGAVNADERRRRKAAELSARGGKQPSSSGYTTASSRPQPVTSVRTTPQPSSSRLVAPASSRPRLSASESPSKRQRRNPGSAIPPTLQPIQLDEDEEAPSGTSYEQVKVFAKQNRVYAPVGAGPRQRQPWSTEEEYALIDLIEQLGDGGISWASLKSADNSQGQAARLVERTAEDMRFKARNMKKSFILSRTPLPDNWEHVALDKKIIDQITARGLTYEQPKIRATAHNR